MKSAFPALVLGATLGLPAHAVTQTFSADTPAGNGAALAAFLTTIDGAPDFNQNFETGFTDNQPVAGPVGNGLSIAGSNSFVESGPGSIGGSNPIGNFALQTNEGGGLRLTLGFSENIDYLGFFYSDLGTARVAFGSETVSLQPTAASGDSSLFLGLIFDAPVTSVTFSDVTGSAGWGLDEIAYGTLAPVPVPAALPLMLAGLGFLGVAARRRSPLRNCGDSG